jgi:hypothetical protein
MSQNVQCTSLGLCPQKIHIQKVPLAHQWFILPKHGAYWPYHNVQWCWPNVGIARPMFEAPLLHEDA